MKKVFVGALISLLATFAAQAQTFNIQTQIDPGSDHKWIKPYIRVFNTSSSNIDLNGKTINYYFYAINQNPNDLIYAIWWPRAPQSNGINVSFSSITPVMGSNGKNANLKCKILFTQSRIISPNQYFEIQLGFHDTPRPGWRVFYENDDWSYYVNKTQWAHTDSITITDGGGNIIYGIGPEGAASMLNRIELAPSSATLNVSDIVTFFATGYDQNNNIIFPVPNLVWSVSSNNGGTYIDQYGMLHAGTVADNFTVTATSGTVQGTANVTVVAVSPLASIVISPSSATVYFLGTKQFTATGYDQNGTILDPQPTFTWSLSTSTQAFINSTTGLFSASMSTGTWVVTATSGSVSGTASISVDDRMALLAAAQEKIKHVIIIMQENRSFDNYFGKYKPGNNQKIDTIPSGISCVYNGTTYSPAHYTNCNEADYGHVYSNAKDDTVGSGVSMYLNPLNFLQTSSATPSQASEIIGYHDITEIPCYWTLADNFVLQDHMFESAPSWSKVSHLYLFSEWSKGLVNGTYQTDISDFGPNIATPYDWNSLANLLDQNSKTWKVYQGVGWSRGTTCDKSNFANNTSEIWPDIWNPLKYFSDVASTYTYANVYNFFEQMDNDPSGLPRVCWIIPNSDPSGVTGVSEHAAQGNLKNGQTYVASIINGIMSNSKLWDSCAIFLSWDDWGGFYDHAIPPKTTDGYGYGLRVPGLLISPYAKKGFVDNQILSHDAYAKFIEDLFCGGTRISNSDNRPSVREDESILGDLLYEFDFSQTPSTIALPCGPTPP